MKKVLHLISSPRGEASYSIQLGNAIIEKIKAQYPGSTITTTNLVQQHFPHLEESHLASFFTPAENHTAEQKEAIHHSNDAINALKEADIIVIGAPMYNFNIHSTLKAWVDHIARAGVTFNYSDKGPEGLVKGKKVYLAVASGGVYSEGPMQAYDFIVPYLKAVLGFIGITDINVVRVEGTAVPGVKEHAMGKAIESIEVV